MHVNDVADYFIAKETKLDGQGLTNLALQKILYFSQGWHLAVSGKRLFEEEVRAWVKGPVVAEVYFRLAPYQDLSIPISELQVDPNAVLSDSVKAFLESIWTRYSPLSANQLGTLTHKPGPWVNARKGLAKNEKSNRPLSDEDMKEYFAKEHRRSLAMLRRADPDPLLHERWLRLAPTT